jgi:hypothetical protein
MRGALCPALAAMLALAACSTPREYMGINIAADHGTNTASPERAQQLHERNLLMLIAILEGCYERVPGGFVPVRAQKAPSFSCARKLVAIEDRSAALGLGRGPSGIAAISLNSLARMAQSGDKNAQLELGIRFEEGIGVPVDLGKARRLYGEAATATGGTIWVYSPPVGNGTSGRVIPLDRGPRQAGLLEAARRLEALAARTD